MVIQSYTCSMSGYTHIRSVSQREGLREVQRLVQGRTANERRSWYSYLRLRISSQCSILCGLNSLD